MILEKIHIFSFRCFEDYELQFAPETTVLIGKNGTGKTNLIAALKKGMSFIFATSKGQQNISTSGDLHISKYETMDARYDADKQDFIYPIGISFVGNFDELLEDSKQIVWEFTKMTRDGSLLNSKYQEAHQKIQNYYNHNPGQVQLPILAFFSDSYPHKKINIGSYAKTMLRIDGSLPRNFGYYMWDAETNCAETWQERYVRVYNSINDFKKTLADIDQKESEEIEYIDKKIMLFTAPLRAGFDFMNPEFEMHSILVRRPKNGNYRIQFAFKDGRKIFFEELPQGYNRLLSIVFDIAYRSYILNGVREPKGIVFIDEVELHLHPSLAQEVLERLRKTFPLIQFIVSTHSPLVISNLKQAGGKNKVVKLLNNVSRFSSELVENIYGIDYTTGLTVMDAPHRISAIEGLIDAFISLKTRKKESQAAIIWAELIEIIGPNNRLIEQEIHEKIKSNQ